MGWSEMDYSNIVFAFQIAYAFMFLVSGRVLDRIGTRLGFAVALVWWSVAAMGHALASSAAGFSFWRFMLGVGESANFPASIKTVAEWFPRSERALATGIFNAGTNIGAIVAPIAVPLIAARWGWRPAFVLTGAIGFVWLFAWAALYYPVATHPRLQPAERDYIKDGADEVTLAKVPLSEVLGTRQL